MITRIQPPRSPDLTPLVFCLWGWMKSAFNNTTLDTADELLLAVAGIIKRRDDLLRRTARDLRTRLAKCVEVGGGILEHLL